MAVVPSSTAVPRRYPPEELAHEVWDLLSKTKQKVCAACEDGRTWEKIGAALEPKMSGAGARKHAREVDDIASKRIAAWQKEHDDYSWAWEGTPKEKSGRWYATVVRGSTEGQEI